MTEGLALGASLPALVWLLDYASALVFALTGALVASRLQLDPVGFIFMATMTAVMIWEIICMPLK